MIRKLTVSNYRSLGDGVSVVLGNFTALVGPNGSGKSNVVDALRFIKDAMEMGLSGAITHRNGISAVRRWSAGHPYNVALEVEMVLEEGPAVYGFEIAGDKQEEYRVKSEHADVIAQGRRIGFRVERGEWKEGPEGLRPPVDDTSLALPAIGGDVRFRALAQALQRITIYSIYPDTLRTPQKYSPIKPMSQHGDNWISILKDQSEDTWQPELIEALRKLTGDIEGIEVTSAASYLMVRFRHKSSTKVRKWFDAAQQSDGTLRVAGILTALLQDPPLPVIGVEEPELTVHPGALPLLFDFLKQASKRSQLIITTHSPELIDLVDADDVRIIERVDGSTTVTRMARSQREAVRQGLLKLGELMVTEGLQQDLNLGQE